MSGVKMQAFRATAIEAKFSESSSHVLRNTDSGLCLTAAGSVGAPVTFQACDRYSTTWDMTDDLLRNSHDLCIGGAGSAHPGAAAVVSPCGRYSMKFTVDGGDGPVESDGLCLGPVGDASPGSEVTFTACGRYSMKFVTKNIGETQSSSHVLRNPDTALCLGAEGSLGAAVLFQACDRYSMTWDTTGGHLQSSDGLCIGSAGSATPGAAATVSPCNKYSMDFTVSESGGPIEANNGLCLGPSGAAFPGGAVTFTPCGRYSMKFVTTNSGE